MSEKNISPDPGLRIRALRERLGFSRKEFENLTGFKANTLRHLEKGSQEVSPTTARMLSIFFIHRFNMDPDEASEHYLLHGKNDTPHP